MSKINDLTELGALVTLVIIACVFFALCMFFTDVAIKADSVTEFYMRGL